MTLEGRSLESPDPLLSFTHTRDLQVRLPKGPGGMGEFHLASYAPGIVLAPEMILSRQNEGA